jgi:serine/threonine protein kinase
MYHEAVYINTNSAFPDAFGAVSYWFVIQQNQTKPALSQSSSRPFLDLLSQSPKTIGFSRHPYEPIEGVERLEIYCVGGYHPINIGDHIHTRYQVVQKLGHGAYSTIWLVRDQRHGKYVAIKVCTVDSNPIEFSVLSELSDSQQSSSTSLGKTMIPQGLDNFEIQGPKGINPCYVSILTRMSLSGADLPSKYGGPELVVIRRFDGQPLPSNIPPKAILPIWLGEASGEIILPEAKIQFSDFGEAFSHTNQDKFKSHTPLVSRPPDARFEPYTPLSLPSDIWSRSGILCGAY